MHDAIGLIEARTFCDLDLAFSVELESRRPLQDIDHLKIRHMGVYAGFMVGLGLCNPDDVCVKWPSGRLFDPEIAIFEV